ncbi:c-type cytochrome [Zhongshania marina]|uniref:Cytochrome C n=1 Tax=Zhongshania marina TaxID=2304603 RepID=A0A2S4HED6_9GAMM|nr:cytochrome c [Marortus luteolus]POP52289.1 cytochrome C [Marortus luteolus]
MNRFLIFAGLLAFTLSAQAADLNTDKQKATSCAACHGATGISDYPAWPNLAEQKEQYLQIQLRAFRDGSRSNPIMNSMIKPLTDTDVENLAAYFANLIRH